MNENIIIWEKWKDPFGDGESDDNLQEDGLGEFYDDNIHDDISSLIKDQNKSSIKQIKVIATPMGIIPLNEHTASGKIFNFWIGHTNFDITKGVFNIIENTDGVETLDIFTRYRFRISIGKAFTPSYVMNKIQSLVYDYLAEITDEKNQIKS